MQIKQPAIVEIEDRVLLEADVITSTKRSMPEKLWYSIRNSKYSNYHNYADPFLIGLLPVAMKLGEPIKVEGTVSSSLAHGISQYQQILNTWWPQVFNKVSVSYQHIDGRNKETRPNGVGCTFSGGVDSFYTLYNQLADEQPIEDYQLTHALMINGFDQVTDFDNDGTSNALFNQYSPLLNDLGVELIMLDSNLKFFRDAVFSKPELVLSFGSPLISCAHACSHIFGRFGLSGHATYSHADLKPLGSHPVLDHHLSTDQLQIMHIGADASRSDKLVYLADKKEVQQSVRVCFGDVKFNNDTGHVVNCGECEKCVRTITTLSIIDKLDKYQTFPLKNKIEVYQQPALQARTQEMFLYDNYKLAESLGKKHWRDVLYQAAQIRQSRQKR